jgi:hypothetical protein
MNDQVAAGRTVRRSTHALSVGELAEGIPTPSFTLIGPGFSAQHREARREQRLARSQASQTQILTFIRTLRQNVWESQTLTCAP